jgi:hypothetical protein
VTDPPSDPFSPDSVRELVLSARSPQGRAIPDKRDAVYQSLARILTRLAHLYAAGQPGVMHERNRKHYEVARAIQTLDELLPAMRIDYVRERDAADERWNVADPGYAIDTHLNLMAHDRLAGAVVEARCRGLPVAASTDGPASPVARATDLVKRLDSIILTSLECLLVGERHDLIAKVAQLITCRTLTPGQVRDRIRK